MKKQIEKPNKTEVKYSIYSSIGKQFKPQGYKSPSEEYPELDRMAGIIADVAIRELNKIIPHVKTKCPYPGQCTLELLIGKLEKCV